MTPAITVLVPARGTAGFLPIALASLRLQSFADWQALVVPVGDAAREMAREAIDGDPRMRVAGDAGLPELEALAQAAESVGSEFLCVLDGDDALEHGALALLHAELLAHPEAGLAYSRHVLVDTGGRALGPGPLCDLPYSRDGLLLDFMTGPLRLFRTRAFRAAGGYDATTIDAADYDLCLRLSEAFDIVHVPQPLYRRRIHPLAPEVARWSEGIEARYRAFVAAVGRRGLDADFDTALEIDSWHILQPLKPFGGVGNLR